jgi:outer membrane autotransporter protein
MFLRNILVSLGFYGMVLFLTGVPAAMAALYEAGNDYNLYGHLYQYDVPVIGGMACCPTTAINSFTYLQNQYPAIYDSRLASKPPTISDIQAIAGPSYMDTGVQSGTSDPLVFWGRYLYLESQLPFQTQYSCQVSTRNGQPIHGDQDDQAWPLNRPLPKYLENTPGPVSVPTWQFLYQNLQKGADVGIGITYLNADGTASGSGHCLTLYAFSFTDPRNDGIIRQGEATVSLVDPADKSKVTCSIWQNPASGGLSGYPYLMLNYGTYGAILDSALAEYPVPQSIPDTVEAGNIVLLKTNSPYGTLAFRGGVLFAGEAQTNWLKPLTMGAEGGVLDTSVNACTLAGAISGGGALSKMGSGPLFLRGTNSYAGGTVLYEGVVNVVQDANLGDPAGPLTFHGGTLQAGTGLSSSRPIVVDYVQGKSGGAFDTGVYASTFSGTFSSRGGSIVQTGQGSLTLSGDGSGFAGFYTVDSGTLNLTNVFGRSCGLTVNSRGIVCSTGTVNGSVSNAGLLYGSGTVNGYFSNAGIVNPGNAVGTLTVNGRYDQTDSGCLQLEVASPASYDRLSITGVRPIAALTGTLKPVLLGGYRPPANTVFPAVIVASGGVYNSSTVIGTPTVSWQAINQANQVDLTLTRDYAKPALGLTPNQQAVGTVFNGLADTTGGDLAGVLNAIDNLPSTGTVGDAYKQISPDKAAALSTLAFAGANLQKGVLARRLTNLRFASREAGVLGGLPGSFNLDYSKLSGLMLAYNSSNLAGLFTGGRKARQAPPESRWGVYLDPAVVFGSQRSSADRTGFDFTIAGFNAGADYRVRDDLLLGLASGYSHTGAGFHGSGGSIENNTWPLTAYAAYLPQSFYAYGSMGYALNLFSLERQISFGGLNRTAKSSPTGNQFNIYAEAGYDLRLQRLMVTPVVSLAYSSLWVDGFTESGAESLNLKVPSQQATSLQTGVGGKVALPLTRDSVVVVPQVYATYQHEYSDSSRGLDARLSQAGSTFAFRTGAPHRNFAVVGANVNLLTQKNLQVQLDYNAEVGRGNYTAHYVSAGVRWQF